MDSIPARAGHLAKCSTYPSPVFLFALRASRTRLPGRVHAGRETSRARAATYTTASKGSSASRKSFACIGFRILNREVFSEMGKPGRGVAVSGDGPTADGLRWLPRLGPPWEWRPGPLGGRPCYGASGARRKTVQNGILNPASERVAWGALAISKNCQSNPSPSLSWERRAAYGPGEPG